MGLGIWVYQASYFFPFVIGLMIFHALIFSIAARQGSRLLLLGAVLAFLRWRDGALLVLPFWILVMLLPGILTLGHEAPQSLRSINVIPAVIVLITLPLAVIWQYSNLLGRPLLRWATRIFVFSVLTFIAFLNINTYFVKYAQHPDVHAAFATDSTMIAFDVRERLNQGDTIFATRDYAYNSVAGLLTSWPSPEVLSLPADGPVAAESAPRGATVYISPREISLFDVLRYYYPDSDIAPVTILGSDRVLYYRAVISHEQLARSHGLTARYTLPGGETRETLLSDTSDIRLHGTAVDGFVPFIAEGTLHIRTPGIYTFILNSDYAAEVLLDGRLLVFDGKTRVVIEPAVGVHRLELRAELVGTAPVELLWQPPHTAEPGPIPSGNLYHDPVRPTGLSGRYFQRDTGLPERPPDVLRLFPTLAHLDWYPPPLPEPYLAVWDGTLEVSVDGDYGIRVREVFGTLTVAINGVTVIPPETPDGTLHLPAGSHTIRVTYFSEQTPSRFQIWWQPPGTTELEVIPIDVLKPRPEYMFRRIGSSRAGGKRITGAEESCATWVMPDGHVMAGCETKRVSKKGPIGLDA